MTSKQFRVLMALTVVAGFLGGAVSNLLLRGIPAQAAGVVQDVVKAKRFELLDGSGKTRAVLGISASGTAQLTLSDVAGTDRAVLGAATGKAGAVLGDLEDAAWLSLYDAAGKSRVALSVYVGGTPSLSLSDAAGNPRIGLTSYIDGSPTLTLQDAQGHDRATIGGTVTVDPKTGARTHFPESTITLFKENGDVTWQVP